MALLYPTPASFRETEEMPVDLSGKREDERNVGSDKL
jgi:hypothetical protein